MDIFKHILFGFVDLISNFQISICEVKINSNSTMSASHLLIYSDILISLSYVLAGWFCLRYGCTFHCRLENGEILSYFSENTKYGLVTFSRCSISLLVS